MAASQGCESSIFRRIPETARMFMYTPRFEAYIMRRREFIYAAAAAAGVTRLSAATDFGPCPKTIEEFLKYIVQRRAAEGLNGIVASESDPRFGKGHVKEKAQLGTVYGGATEDANIAWTAASAYRYPWSRMHRDAGLRDRAFLLMDNIARIRASGTWDDGGLDAYFGVHSFGWAVLSWMEQATLTRHALPSGATP